MSNEKDLIVMFLLGLSTPSVPFCWSPKNSDSSHRHTSQTTINKGRSSILLFLYIPQFPTRCREYAGEIYELQYYYHPPILFLSFFLFLFLFPFYIFTLLYTNYH
jgi:hypothetical protein